MDTSITLKNQPKIKFQLLDSGFRIIDERRSLNSGFYSYDDLQTIELRKPWFPRFAKWLRIFTWILNGVPFFPSAEDYAIARLTFRFRKTKIGIPLTDSFMSDQARKLQNLLETRRK